MKQLTVNDLRASIGTLEDYDIPVVIVGEQQVAVSADLIYQSTLDGDEVPVALQIQLVPNGQ